MKKRRLWTREEDALLKSLAGKCTAEEIGLVLGRPKSGVHHRISRLKLNGMLCGEAHWNAKIPNLTAGMIGALHDAGYLPSEIHRVVTGGLTVTRQHVEAICNQRHRRQTHAA